ncbi:MAG: Obg family GTPase CgtA, partial [Opitutales bacterium]|nr:Obg family GTPase CgtA [Opitutales bacterium]
ANGAHCFLKVPEGTVVVNNDTGAVATELLHEGERVVLLKGGKGGKGNTTFKSSVNQAPQRITLGMLGECGEFTFVLKTIADIGLVGFPNAGKSSLINALTRTQQKSASYPFTTLSPKVGIIPYPERYQTLTIADIPGLIPGAHQNRGLGIKFLKHIERCKVLVFLIDIAAEDGQDPLGQYRVLRQELQCYSKTLLSKKQLIVLNKMDLPSAAENVKKFKAALREETLEISCTHNIGLEALKEKLYAICEA